MDRSEGSLRAPFRAAQEARENAAALRAESRRARRQAADVRAEANAILDGVGEMITHALRLRGFTLRAPVAATFRTDRGRSTGLEIVVQLEDPSHADAARAALSERFPDPLSTVIIR